jgi:RNA ligase
LKYTELFSFEELMAELDEGYVKRQLHPTLPLTILNYTDKTTYEQRWNNVTTHCRGLIVCFDTDEVIARGPRKFFNYGEPSGFDWPLDTPVIVSKKEDGSLGIGWVYSPDEGDTMHWGLATRGSFTSEQAVHAMELIDAQSKHDGPYELWYDSVAQYADHGISYIGEIVYPENRIVLDYGDKDEVIPLGTVNNKTGLIHWRPEFDHNGKAKAGNTSIARVITLGDALALPIPDDEEGYVLDILDPEWEVIDHLKLKGDKYKELHSAIFGLTERKVYDAWVACTESSLIEELPDELQPWALGVTQRFDEEWAVLRNEVRTAFRTVPVAPRRDQATFILENHKELAPALFARLDQNWVKVNDWIEKQIKPGHVPFKIIKETVSQ